MVPIFILCLLSFVICQGASGQESTTRTHTITAGSGPGSLTDYLHNASQVFSSFTTLVFSPGVHHMCEDSVVVIRDVTNIALIGSETTTTKSVQVGDGEVVDVIEPSTVIDCHGCPTGFAFSNVTQLTLKRITMTQCGGYFTVHYASKVSFVQISTTVDYLASLTLVAVKDFTLNTLLFRNSGGNYNLVVINALGNSTIVNMAILQNDFYFPGNQVGNILLLYTDSLFPQTITNDEYMLSVVSMAFLYDAKSANFTFLDDTWSFLMINVSTCHPIQIMLRNITVHAAVNPPTLRYYYRHFIINKVLIEIEVSLYADGYEIDIQSVTVSGTRQDIVGAHALKLLYTSLQLDCPVFPLPARSTVGVITVTDLVSQYYGVEIDVSMPNEQKHHQHRIILSWCKLPSLEIKSSSKPTSVALVVQNTVLENKHNNVVVYEISLLTASGVPKFLVKNCSFLHNSGGSGVHLHNSIIFFMGNCTFYNNTATYGGGILMEGKESKLYLLPNTTLSFVKNSAMLTGGAMHIYPYTDWHCFIKLKYLNLSLPDIKLNAEQQNIHVLFKDNSAGVAGTAIWGGLQRDYCKLNKRVLISIVDLLAFFDLANNDSSLSTIASSPRSICYCNGTLLCTEGDYSPSKFIGPSFNLYSGQSLEVEIALAGQLNGLVPGLVQAELKETANSKAGFGKLQRTQRINKAKCTMLTYTIHSSRAVTEIELHLFLAKTIEHESEHLNSIDNYNSIPLPQISITCPVILKQCPSGFQHNPTIGACTCLQALLHYMDNTSCDIDTQTVQRTSTLWINASFTRNSTQTLAVHQHCPFDYCDPNKHRLDLSYPHQQCAHNRSGILCGGCRRGLSLTLGSPKCKQCSNKYLFLLVMFPMAGIALVAVLTCLNLTVSVGTINGLILYVNIIQAIHSTFFPSTNFLSVFIAWMNLDIGMESCLYDRMDFYGLTWLQFVFPVYIWLLVSIMIITSHYSTTAAKLVSRDAVKVLATLFLLSYAKLLRAIITVLSFTYISYEDSDGTTYRSAVWLYDGNVGFMKEKHIPLFLVAVGFGTFYIIPFTLLLLFAPCLQARSHRYRALRWVNKLMPFLDAYQGPYNRRFRFWSGLLLMTRVVMFIAFAFNSLGDPQINLMLILTFLVILRSLQLLLSSSWQFGTLFIEPLTNYLQMFYHLNLMILSTWSLLQLDNTTSSLKKQTIISNVFVGLALLVFVFILAYHAYLRLKGVQYVTKLWNKMKARNSSPADVTGPPATQKMTEKQSDIAQKTSTPITIIQLREPLLTDN